MKKKQMARGVLVLAIVLAVLGLAGYLVAQRMVAWGTGLVVRNLNGASVAEGVAVTSASCGGTSVGGPTTAVWRDFDMTVAVRKRAAAVPEGEWRLAVDRVKLTWRGLFSGTLHGVFKNVSVEPVQEVSIRSATRTGRRVEIDGLHLHFDRISAKKEIRALSPTAFKIAVGDYARDVMRWAHGEEGASPIELAGTLRFKIGGRQLEIGLQTVDRNGRNALVAERNDVRQAAKVFGDELTEAEARLAARHPLRIPGMMAAKTTAEQMARAEYGTAAKSDAYRHIAWSWLLSERFGAEFAQEVTAAHEEGADNSTQERERDHANNRLGRSYWEQKVPFDALKQNVESDPRVVL